MINADTTYSPEKDVKILKLFKHDEPNINTRYRYKALLGVKTSTGYLPVRSGCMHQSYWRKEFNLTQEEIEKLIV
ncbi:hypothetical protein A0256_23285 [Mucilaginibacter sp. PAMC 26640]|nr:hypothetical protein A0256_23285 [Mucilaginibacter sp. PAMC 26640]